MPIVVFLEILLGVLLILSALVTAAVLWARPSRPPDPSRGQPVEDRPDWPPSRVP
ncbi:hypothetical protein ACTMTF_07345 [Nonomuraea sp. ZG12]|jgi:hypothetical protein|uniref:hypothetical protein n=1 Tax=Nonomuraea sp. ZG12 TaxID=3452207 RepID=UPI003F8AD8AC